MGSMRTNELSGHLTSRTLTMMTSDDHGFSTSSSKFRSIVFFKDMGQGDSLKGSVVISDLIYIFLIATDCFCHHIATLKEKRTCVITIMKCFTNVKSQSVYDFTGDCLATMCFSASVFKGAQVSVRWFGF